MELINDSPYVAERAVIQDGRGRDRLVVVVKATYRMRPDELELSEEQLPIQLADSFYGPRGESRLRYECDLSPPKPATDVVLIGHAHAPGGAAEQLDVSLAVGRIAQTIRVFGERAWSTAGAAPRPTRPLPFGRMPLVYERAFGGIDTSADAPSHHEAEERNPVGVGFRAERSRRPVDGDRLPNLEDPAALIASPHDRPEPVGFGVIARSWMPRRGYAGTYDDRWSKERAPLPPADFDDRFLQCGHPRLVSSRHLQGGEPVSMTNASPTGRPLGFTLPTRHPTALVLRGAAPEALPLGLDLVALEPDDERAILLWRGGRALGRDLFAIEQVRIQENA